MSRTWRAWAIALLLAGVIAPGSHASTTLYLHADGTPSASLSPAFPISSTLLDYAPERDAWPGLHIESGGANGTEVDPARYQQWASAPGPLTIDGPLAFEFWAAMSDFTTGERGIVNAYVLDCDSTGTACTKIASGTRDILDWSGGLGSWSRHVIGFGRVTHLIDRERSLALRVEVSADSDDDMIFAYGTAEFPARLTDGARDDIAVDCSFGDWIDGAGVEFVVNDQGGANDYGSPGRLDVTVFGVSSNLVDAAHVLMGLDETSLNGGVVATLIDTDLDNNANFAFVATVNGSAADLELYRCDDTLTDGCGSAALRRVYPATQFCVSTAAVAWDSDTLIEAALPFGDVHAAGGPVVLTSLVSYAAASLLTSPKDSVLGSAAQDYESGIYFDLSTGYARLTSGVRPEFLVRRSSDPAAVRTAPFTSVLTAPVDEPAGSLTDGVDSYYVVEQGGAVPVTISVQANTFGDAVRLGFDDLDPRSAPVDPLSSSVTLDATGIAIDGTTAATVTVVPRDGNGEPIGAGCAIDIDGISLLPATVASLTDHRDGSYSIRITSKFPGIALVVVSVEGTPLIDQPLIEFVAP